NLPDGTAFLVHAPNDDKLRIPLVLSLSEDGHIFDRAFLLRGADDLQPLRTEGLYKRPGYHYPKSWVASDYLFIAYTANKEDVDLTRIPLSALEAR
ncbi:exo-alpha-sialidase, partial [Hyphomonas atlantica]